MVDYTGYNTSNNYILPPEFYNRNQAGVINMFRKESHGRKVIDINNLGGGIGVQSYGWEHRGEMSEAALSWGVVQLNEDQTSGSRQSIDIPMIHKEFRLSRRDMATAAMNGYALVNENISAAAYQLSQLENRIIFDGHQDSSGAYDVKGLFQLAGTSITDDLPISTYGNTTKAVTYALDALDAKELYGPMNFIMNNRDHARLQLSKNEFGIREIDEVQGLLGGGRIIPTYYQPFGTPILTPTLGSGHPAVEMVITQDVVMDTEVESKTKNFWGQIIECFNIRSIRPDHIVKFTQMASP